MSTRNLIILGNSFITIILSLISCTNHFISRVELCENSCQFWDTSPFDTVYFEDCKITTATSYKFCNNDSVYIYVYLIEDSLRNNCCSPHTRKWKIKENALIINTDTIFIEKYLKRIKRKKDEF